MKPILIALLSFGICAAQTPEAHSKDEDQGFLQVSFVVKELDEAKVTNTRSYTTIIAMTKNANSTVRTGSKIPVPNGPGQITFIDLGANFDCRFQAKVGNSLRLSVSADISSIAANSPDSSSGSLGPVIRQNRWNSDVIVPIAKPTTIYSSDDLTSKRKMQIEITATPITP